MNTTNEAYNLLVIEDDPSEQKLIKIIVKNSHPNFNINFIGNGEDALTYINTIATKNKSNGKINLVLLDLNIPKINGIEVLKAFKKSNKYKSVPVVILTTSNNLQDVERAYEAGASGYIRKPNVIQDYENVLNDLFHYWFKLCLTP